MQNETLIRPMCRIIKAISHDGSSTSKVEKSDDITEVRRIKKLISPSACCEGLITNVETQCGDNSEEGDHDTLTILF